MNRSTPWIVALLASVLVNGAMLGVTLHAVADGPRIDVGREGGGPPGVRGDGFSVRGFLSAIPPEHRDDAEARLRAKRDDVIRQMRHVREAQARVEEVLLREPFDAEALRSAMDDLRQARGSMESEVETAIIDILAQLPPDVRVRALQDGMRRGPHHRGGPRERRGPPTSGH